MKMYEIFNIYEDDNDHGAALRTTGFWGKQGAGCIFLAKDTGRFCIAHRSRSVEQPNTWGTWGGAMDSGETPIEAARREVEEEAGYTGDAQFVPLFVFNHSSGFRYSNFLAIVETEFTPQMDWETQGFKWVEFGEWPQPLHFGMQSILADPASMATIKHFLSKLHKPEDDEIGESRMKDLSMRVQQGAPNPLEKKPATKNPSTKKPVSKQSTRMANLAKKSGKSIEHVTAVWNHAKQQYGTNWALVTSQVKKELGI